MQYADNVRVVALPCTGKVDVKFLLAALENGADGVMAVGCMEGDCHYLTGNLRARKRVERVKKTLAEIGIEPERVEMYNLSAGQGPRFAAIVNEFTERIAGLGPMFKKQTDVAVEAAPAEIQS